MQNFTHRISGLSLAFFFHCLGVYAQVVSAPQQPFVPFHGLTVDFTQAPTGVQTAGANPTEPANSTHGYTDRFGRVLFEIYDEGISGGIYVQPYNLTGPVPNRISFTYHSVNTQLMGELEIIPFPCESDNPNRFLLITQEYTPGGFNMAGVWVQGYSELHFHEYNHGTQTIIENVRPKITIATDARAKAGLAISRLLHPSDNEESKYQILYVLDGEVVTRTITLDQNVFTLGQAHTRSLPGANVESVNQIEISHSNSRYAILSASGRVFEGQIEEYFNQSNRIQENHEIILPPGRLATGIEFSPDERYLFVNAFVPQGPGFSGIQRYDLNNTQSPQWIPLSADFSHSHLGIMHDGFLYATSGTQLLRMNPLTGQPLQTFPLPTPANNTFWVGYDINPNHPNALPTGTDAFVLPDQIDGYVHFQSTPNALQLDLSQWNGTVCGGDLDILIPDNIASVDISLIAISGSTPPDQEDLPGNAVYQLDELFPSLVCSGSFTQEYELQITVSSNCNPEYTVTSLPFHILCDDVPEFTIVKNCRSNLHTVTLSNPPGGTAEIDWLNAQGGSLGLANQLQVSLAPGTYSVEYSVPNSTCAFATPFTITPCRGEYIPDPFRRGDIALPASTHFYPNPVTDQLHWPASLPVGSQVQVTDMLGRTQSITAQNTPISVSTWEPGLYLFSWQEEGSWRRERVLISGK